jgi:transposase-like protein
MGKDARRTYTDEQRKEALELYVEHGPTEASDRTGVPAPTISSWARRCGKTTARSEAAQAAVDAAKATWAQRKARVATDAGEAAENFVQRAVGSNRSRDVRNLMGAAEAAIRVAQLLDGGATGRLELSEEEAIAELRRLRDEVTAEQGDELAAKRQRRAASA